MNEKPLFLPVKTEYYNQFKNRTKVCEFRKFSKKWDAETCKIGRKIIISKGYTKNNRLIGVISGYDRKKGSAIATFKEDFARQIKECYGTLDIEIAQIYIKDIKELEA